MLGRRAAASLLAIVVLLLGTLYSVAPSGAAMGHGAEPALTDGMPGGCGDCDHGQLPSGMRCQVSCMGLAAAFLAIPTLTLPTPAGGWFPTVDVRGSGREPASDLPPPKHSDMA